jgi:hypothetical protein
MPKNGRKIYAACTLDTESVAKIVGPCGTVHEAPLELKWADGQIGAMAVFSNKKKAKKYAGSEKVITLKVVGLI